MIVIIALEIVILLVEWAGIAVALMLTWATWHIARKGLEFRHTHKILENKESNGVSNESCGCDPPCRSECP
jgi:hypothetical protein